MTFNSITPGSVDHFAAAMMIIIMIECKGGGGGGHVGLDSNIMYSADRKQT